MTMDHHYHHHHCQPMRTIPVIVSILQTRNTKRNWSRIELQRLGNIPMLTLMFVLAIVASNVCSNLVVAEQAQDWPQPLPVKLPRPKARSLTLSSTLPSSRSAQVSSVSSELLLDNQNLNVIPTEQLCSNHSSHSRHVNSVSFASNNLSQIEANTFDCIGNELKILNLNQNNIEQIGENSFKSLGSLLVLRLDHNKLDKIPSKAALKWLKSLRHLNLAGNRIASIEPQAFGSELGNLLSLDLKSNPIYRADSLAFVGLNKLQTLSMSDSSLVGELPKLSGLGKLRFLNLDRNSRLNSLPSELCSKDKPLAPSLASLVLRSSGFAQVPEFGDSAKCEGLLILDLTYNQIGGHLTGLPFRNAPNLLDLYLGHNQIEFVDSSCFVGLHNLQVLVLEHNRLHSIHDFALKPLRSSLMHLNLAHNSQLSRLASLDDLEQLKSFKCYGNPRLKQLPPLAPSVEWLALTYAYHCCDYHRKAAAELPEPMATPSGAWITGNDDQTGTSSGPDGVARAGRWLPLHWVLGARWLPRRAAPNQEFENNNNQNQNHNHGPDAATTELPVREGRRLIDEILALGTQIRLSHGVLLFGPSERAIAKPVRSAATGNGADRESDNNRHDDHDEFTRIRTQIRHDQLHNRNDTDTDTDSDQNHNDDNDNDNDPAQTGSRVAQVMRSQLHGHLGSLNSLGVSREPTRRPKRSQSVAGSKTMSHKDHQQDDQDPDAQNGTEDVDIEHDGLISEPPDTTLLGAPKDLVSGARRSPTGSQQHQTRAQVRCWPEPSALLPCDDLLDSWWLRLGTWLVFVASLIGNLLVIVVLCFVRQSSSTSGPVNILWFPHSHRRHIDVPRFLVINLAVADVLMGAYLGTLALVDALTAGHFRLFAIEWQHSRSCKLAGFVAVASAELSVYILAVITLERLYAITNAVHLNRRMSLHRATVIILVGYALAIAIASMPLQGISDYSSTSVCLPLDVTSRLSSWSREYLAMLISVNSCGFLLLLGCYLRMYCAIRGSQAWNSNDTRIAKRMSVLVATDFACWVPIICIGVASLAGYQLVSLRGLKVLTIFLLPLNSVANPFLYAITTKKFKRDLLDMLERSRRLLGCPWWVSSSTKSALGGLGEGSLRPENLQIGCETPLAASKGQYRLTYTLDKAKLRRHAGGAKAASSKPNRNPGGHNDLSPYQQPQRLKRPALAAGPIKIQVNKTSSQARSALLEAHRCNQADGRGARGYPKVLLTQDLSWVASNSNSNPSSSSESDRESSPPIFGAPKYSWKPPASHRLGVAPNGEMPGCLPRSLSSNEHREPPVAADRRPKSADCTDFNAFSPESLLRRRRRPRPHQDHNHPGIHQQQQLLPDEARCHSALGSCVRSSQEARERHLLASLWSCATGSGHLTKASQRRQLKGQPAERIHDKPGKGLQFANSSANASANNNTWSSIQIMSSRSSELNNDVHDEDDESIDGSRCVNRMSDFDDMDDDDGLAFDEPRSQGELMFDEILPELISSPTSKLRMVARLTERRMSKSCELMPATQSHEVDSCATYMQISSDQSSSSRDYDADTPNKRNPSSHTSHTATTTATTTTTNDDDDRRVLIETINRLASRKRQLPRLIKPSETSGQHQHFNRGNSIGARCRSWSPALLGKLDFCMSQIRNRIGSPKVAAKGSNLSVDSAASVKTQRSGHFNFNERDDATNNCRQQHQQPFNDLQEHDEEDDNEPEEDGDDHEQVDSGSARPSHEFNRINRHRAFMARRPNLRHQSSITSDNLSTRTGATILTNLSLSIDSNATQDLAQPSSDDNNIQQTSTNLIQTGQVIAQVQEEPLI